MSYGRTVRILSVLLGILLSPYHGHTEIKIGIAGPLRQLSEFIDFMRTSKKTDQALLDALVHYVQSINRRSSFEDDFTILAATFR